MVVRTLKNQGYKKFIFVGESFGGLLIQMLKSTKVDCLGLVHLFSVFDFNYSDENFKTICNTYENEVAFYKRYYEVLVAEECGKETTKTNRVANELFDMVWLKDRELFNDVLPVFKALKENEIKIGIISDTTPSLRKTLEALGLGEYISSYTCSKEVGVMKPDPKIYLAALASLGMQPNECLYVDDYLPEVVGAQDVGFMAFRINRDGAEESPLDIKNLSDVLENIKHKNKSIME